MPARRKMHINKFWHNTSHANEHTKYISTCVVLHARENIKGLQKTPPIPGKNTRSLLTLLTKLIQRQDTKCISTCVDQTMPRNSYNVSQHVLTKPSYASVNIKFILTRVEDKNASQHVLTPFMPSRSQNASQIMSSKNNPCQQEHKMHLNMCWPNPFQTSVDTKYITTCVEKTYPIPVRTQNLSLHVFTKPIPRPWANKMYLNLCWRNPPMPATTHNVSQLVLNKPLQC